MNRCKIPAAAQTVLLHVGVGMGAASFWRGLWYILDDQLFPHNKEASAAASLSLGVLGMAWTHGLVRPCDIIRGNVNIIIGSNSHNNGNHNRITRWSRSGKLTRFGALYAVAISGVLVWRGTWLGWDCLYERLHNHHHNNNPSQPWIGVEAAAACSATDPGHATHSGLLSHITALTLLLGTGLFASVLAPPAAVSILRDGVVRTTATASSSLSVPLTLRRHPSYHHAIIPTLTNSTANSPFSSSGRWWAFRGGASSSSSFFPSSMIVPGDGRALSTRSRIRSSFPESPRTMHIIRRTG